MGSKRREESRVWRRSRRWTPEDAREALAAAEVSGQPLVRFAAEHGLSVHRLSRWRKRLREHEATTTPVFEEIPTSRLREARSNDAQERFEIVLRSGRVVRVSDTFDAEALRRLLSVVDEGAPC